jgi:hypothetical protein
MRPDYRLDVWTGSNPSRRLRKLYKALAALDAEMATVRATRFVPEHAPMTYTIMRATLRPLEEARWALLNRIDALQNYDDLTFPF